MTNHDLLRRLHDVPFRPFRIRLSNATLIEVREPGSIIVGRSSAVIPVKTVVDDRGFRIAEDWRTIALSHMVEFSDLDLDTPPKRKKNAG